MALLDIISETLNWSTFALAAVVCLIVYVYVQWSQRPPGPIGFPYIGYYPFLSEDNFYMELFQLTKKYGKVFCFTATGQQYAHISDPKAIREVMVTKFDCFQNKTERFTLFHDAFGGGVVTVNGEEWKTLRKFFILKFKDFGMGKKTQEGVLQDSLKKIVSSLKQSDGKEFDVLNLFMDISSDVVRNMLFGSAKLDENDIRQFNESYAFILEFSMGRRSLLAGPIVKYILLPFLSEYQPYRKHRKQMETIIVNFIRQQEKDFDRNNIRNVVDAYISEKKLLEEEKDPRAKYFTGRGLVMSLYQFFGDGSLGTGGFAAIVLNILSSYPDIQKAMQTEIDEVIGGNRLPSLDDKSKLSYTNAVVYEGLRMAKFTTLVPSVECSKETTIGGFRIPKGTIVLYNFWATFRDPELYDEPDKFDPTRFLSVDGKKPRCDIPFLFGVGKRSCIGEPLVTMQILLYVATVLQHFDLHPVKEYGTQNVFIKATPRAV